MCICDDIADANVTAPTVERGIQDPGVAAKRVGDRGHHGYACGAPYAANVGHEDVAADGDFADVEGVT
jgi:hypothetical protein